MKKTFIIFMSVLLFLNINSITLANNLETPSQKEVIKLPYYPEEGTLKIPVGKAKYIKDSKGNLIKISDLLSFESEEEADEFSQKIKLELNKSVQINPKNQITPMATNGDALVDKKRVSFAGSINLRVAYRTSGDSNTGRITYHDAYTTFTGFNLGFGWDERTCYSQIKSSGKDIYAYASGTLDYYILVDGFIKYYSTPVTLSGTIWAVR